MRKKQDQLFKLLADGDPRGLLDFIHVLRADQTAEVKPMDRELVRDPILIDQGFVIEEPGKDPWVAHIECFGFIQKKDWERVYWYAHDLVGRTRLDVRTTVVLPGFDEVIR